MVPSVWRCVDSNCASLRQQWQRAGTAGRLPAEQRFHRCSNERSRSHRLRAEEVRGRGRMVRRRGLSVRAVTSRAGSDVLAGCVAVQREPRSHSARQSRRGASQYLPSERVGEQGDSVAALGSNIPIGMRRPPTARKALGFSPLLEARRGDASSVKGIP